ncbi:N-acetylgalactosamine-6-sulfatase [Paracidovorax avenae ATCC 19860]|uniref:N-acetylgalactosamine-6-sulfatase n=1 Tax=Paracidovorax avenae (strain ATCC 19860 / DSM 7227 / CCUG 15838 / JCM 20985 / LMG 2117 / NCPPB 1011) TaxID=643561 RepID=F0Q7R4_PARA1|nr:sulfatase-like hydrolase/transferase [Paracidovorax avenae]ADX48246.1 N-acetylgalactosamine-6-sulfatase [Paracidovorax avenae ATCC 19860]
MPQQKEMPQRPNILFIVADDLGYADLGCYGGRDAAFGPVSPVLDRLAAGGLKLTQGYSNSPVCSPTRFALMTARYQYRLRGAAEEPIRTATRGNDRLGLPPAHPTLPSLLKDAGYRTALMGKWHLGYPPHFSPLKSGYEEFFGPMSGGVDYFTHCGANGTHDLWFGEEEKAQEGYLTDLITDHSVDYIERMAAGAQQGSPFFLSVHYTAPHWPWETRDDEALAHELRDSKQSIYHLAGGNVETYRRMVHHMDEGIGRIMDTLRAHGLERDTLVVFTSDNGGERFSDNWPLVGGKMDLTEGGIRVPWIAHWPAAIAPGGTSPQPCLTMDWSATMLELGGAQPHPDYPWDGRTLAPLLHDAAWTADRPLFWRMNHRGQRAMRQGDWKYLRVDGVDYLFNLAQDERERANLAPLQPGRLAEMVQAWEAWEATMPAIPGDATVSLCYTDKDMPSR